MPLVASNGGDEASAACPGSATGSILSGCGGPGRQQPHATVSRPADCGRLVRVRGSPPGSSVSGPLQVHPACESAEGLLRRLVDVSRVKIPVPVRSWPRWSRRIPSRITNGIGHGHARVFMKTIGDKAAIRKVRTPHRTPCFLRNSFFVTNLQAQRDFRFPFRPQFRVGLNHTSARPSETTTDGRRTGARH